MFKVSVISNADDKRSERSKIDAKFPIRLQIFTILKDAMVQFTYI
jgi:hypothetical protein